MANKVAPLSEVDERELIARSKSGDADAFTELVNRNEKRIYTLAYQLLNNREDAEDILQETFLRAYNNLGSFRGDSSFNTWLHRITTNLVISRFRKKKLDTESLDEPIIINHEEIKQREIVDWSDIPDKALLKKELNATIDSAIAALPLEYRSVITLRDIEGLSNEEAGKILGISVAAVKSRLHRARLFVREKLDIYLKSV
ncbi:MAG: sigma-70 family RNA polymerase sigma factor [bacterium]|nr:sigma-70 family RNA polymerase sigma factor [bacterium]